MSNSFPNLPPELTLEQRIAKLEVQIEKMQLEVDDLKPNQVDETPEEPEGSCGLQGGSLLYDYDRWARGSARNWYGPYYMDDWGFLLGQD